MNYLQDITNISNFLLKNFPAAKPVYDYISSRISEDSCNKFKLGYFPNHEHIDVLLREIDEEILFKNNLLWTLEIADSLSPCHVTKPWFEDHPLIIPYFDVYGDVVGLIGRTLLSEEDRKALKIDKYKATSFKKGNQLYGLFESKQSILENDAVYVVEGQFDVIKAHEVGITNIVALGNAQMTAFQFSLICRYTRNIYLLLDNDDAGEKGRKSINDKYGKLANIKDVFVPAPFKDLDECLKDNPTIPTLRIKK